MVDFQRGPRELELEQRTLQFIRESIIPYESDPRLLYGVSDDLVQEMRQKARLAGLLSPQVGSEWGGYGLNHREIATVLRASGYSLLGPLAMNCAAPDEGNMQLLERVATSAQKEQYLKPLAAGNIRSSFFMTEPDGGAGSDPSMMRTEAYEDGNHWIINGRKWFISGIDGATFGIIMARTGTSSTMFLTPLPTPGLSIERVMRTADEAWPGGHGVIYLDDVRVHRSQILGEAHEGFRYAQIRLAPARLTHCMRWWGAARRAHDIATEYACKRQSFGCALIDHEGVGFSLARNEIDLRQTQLMIDYVAWTLDQGSRASSDSSMAKYSCAETLFQIVDRCVQILGGSGIVDETQVSRIWRQIRGFRIYDGPSEVHLFSLAQRLKRAEGIDKQ